MTLNKSWQQAYDLGAEMADRFDSEREALNSLSFDQLEDFMAVGYGEFFHAGFIGREPEWVTAFRYGEIPEEGRSINWAENKWEPGVSVVAIINDVEDAECLTTKQVVYSMMGRERIIVQGWYLGNYGSDGEPTLWGCVKVD